MPDHEVVTRDRSDDTVQLARGLHSHASQPSFRSRYIQRMLCLPLLDLGVIAVFIFVTRRYEAIGAALANMLVLGLFGFVAGWWLYHPIARFESSTVGKDKAVTRIRNLPRYSAMVAFPLVLIYMFTAFWLGVFTPPGANFDAIPLQVRLFALLFYSTVYASFYAYFLYFLVNDLCINMRRELRNTMAFQGNGEFKDGLARKLAGIFVVVSLLPAVLLGMDLTLFAPMREVQGLTTGNVIALDLLASMYVIGCSILFVSRSLLAQTRELFDAQEAARRGDFKSKAAVLADDELGEVTANFNTMIDALSERDLLKSALHRYLSPTIANELLKSGGMIESKLVEATVMFTDIQGFTALSETLAPEETVELLNAYFSLLNAIIHREGGTINNFIGDAIVAIFNVPTANANHARSAIQAAQAIQRALENEIFTLQSGRIVSLPTRIGINTGSVYAGVIGSAERQGYTVYGDAVNLAARIEPLNKRYQTRILASDSTVKAALKQGLSVGCVAPIEYTSVAGRKEGVMVYRIDFADSSANADPDRTIVLRRSVQ